MIDPKNERKAIYKSFKGKPGPCSRCGGVLKQSHQSYMLATQTGGRKTDSFIMGGDFGWFCASCPTVVLNKDELDKLLSYRMPCWKIGKEIAVLGILNLGRPYLQESLASRRAGQSAAAGEIQRPCQF